MSEGKNKVGRPRTAADGEKRDRKVVTYVSAGEQEVLRRAAEVLGVPHSTFVRSLLLSRLQDVVAEDQTA